MAAPRLRTHAHPGSQHDGPTETVPTSAEQLRPSSRGRPGTIPNLDFCRLFLKFSRVVRSFSMPSQFVPELDAASDLLEIGGAGTKCISKKSPRWKLVMSSLHC